MMDNLTALPQFHCRGWRGAASPVITAFSLAWVNGTINETARTRSHDAV